MLLIMTKFINNCVDNESHIILITDGLETIFSNIN